MPARKRLNQSKKKRERRGEITVNVIRMRLVPCSLHNLDGIGSCRDVDMAYATSRIPSCILLPGDWCHQDGTSLDTRDHITVCSEYVSKGELEEGRERERCIPLAAREGAPTIRNEPLKIFRLGYCKCSVVMITLEREMRSNSIVFLEGTEHVFEDLASVSKISDEGGWRGFILYHPLTPILCLQNQKHTSHVLHETS